MKNLLAAVVAGFLMVSAQAKQEIITVVIGAGPTQSNVPLIQKTLEEANKLQNKYLFVPEFKPGAQGVIAARYMDQDPKNRISGIAPSFVENVKAGHLKEEDYVPVFAQGDACWAVVTNVGDTKRGLASLADIRGQEIIVGGTGFGNAAHITSLMLAERYGFKVKYIVFKSNYDGLINMVGNNGVNMVLERVVNYQQFKEKQPKLQILGINCGQRVDDMPEVRTVREQGFNTPTIFQMTIANRAMPAERRKEIGDILNRAQVVIGKKTMIDMADLLAPQFEGVTTEEYFRSRISIMKTLTTKYEKQIEASR